MRGEPANARRNHPHPLFPPPEREGRSTALSTIQDGSAAGRGKARRKLQEWKLDLDPGRRDQHDLVFDHARHRIPGAFVLTQRFTHGSPSRPHKRAGVKTEPPIAFSTGVRLSVSGGCLSHIPCVDGPTDRPLRSERGPRHCAMQPDWVHPALNCPASARNSQLAGKC